jgi:2-phosphosulfolactate phosphatase
MSTLLQSQFNLKVEWGLEGLLQVGPSVEVVVIVDVLSFSTAVEVAVSQGATVYPFPMRDDSAAEFAEHHTASLAVSRTMTNKQNLYSLSPASFLQMKSGARVVLPSPNGSTLSLSAGKLCSHVLCGCLRNAQAVAVRAQQLGRSVAVIAAGELWSTGSDGRSIESQRLLRPALEDLIGAGAILASMTDGSISPEATAAVAVFDRMRTSLPENLMSCASGCELIEMGFPDDVRIASKLNVGTTVPQLVDGAYRAV